MNVYSLMYHDVVEPGASAGGGGFDIPGADLYKLESAMFERHVTAISASVAAAGVDRASTPREIVWRKPTQPPAVLLHFDDGGKSALAIADRLERAGWHGFFHITTDRIGTQGFVTAANVRELHARGHVVGSHSCSHPSRMSSLPDAELAHEWSASKAKLEDLTGAAIEVASVPNGASSHRVAMAAERAGIGILFTSEPTSRDEWVLGCLVLGRYSIRRHTPPETAAALAIGATRLRLEQWAAWNTKRLAKRIVGKHWEAIHRRLLGT